jgi:hypothetical protein
LALAGKAHDEGASLAGESVDPVGAAREETADNRASMATVRGMQVVAAALAIAMGASGCAAHAPARSLPAGKAAPAPSSGTLRAIPAAAAPPRRCAPTDRDYETWFTRTFGSDYEVFHDGPDSRRIRDLAGEPKAEAERMLRRGLSACSTFAVSAIEGAGWRDLVPDLTQAVALNGESNFRASVILALKTLASRDDFTDELIAVMTAGSTEARMTAAMGARHFSLDRFRGPLLDRVRRDPEWLVRYHAAESLFELADIYPRELSGHPALMAAIAGKALRDQPLLGGLGLSPAPTPEEGARLARAADQLDAEITARLGAGRCSELVTPPTIDLHILRVRDPHIVALTVEESIGSCQRKLAFLVFLHSPAGFGRWLGALSSGKDPFRGDVATAPNPVKVSYSRATGVVTVGTYSLDTSKANVALLTCEPNGVVARYQRTVDLTFERDGHPAPRVTGIAPLDAQPEIIIEARKFLERTPELRALVGN